MKGLVDYYIVTQYQIEDEFKKKSSNDLNYYCEDMVFAEVSDEILELKIKEIFEE